MGETRREIIHVSEAYPWQYKSTDTIWDVHYRVWGMNGKDLGTWTHQTKAQDEEGAILKTAIKWAKDDKRNARRREKKEQTDE